MEENLKNNERPAQTRFSFGVTSAIITNLGIITGLNTLTNPKPSIIGALLVIALADNLSDSFGIHIYQESEYLSRKEVLLSTLTNFFSRLFVSLSFIAMIFFLPIKIAVACSIIWGLIILMVITYTITKKRNLNPYSAITVHIFVAIVVVTASNFLGAFLVSKFHG